MATANGKDGGRNRARTAIVLAGLAGTAFFLAAGITQLVAAATLDPLLVAAPRSPADDGVATVSTRRNRVADGTAILRRNLFDSTVGPMEWELPEPVVEDIGGPDEVTEPVVVDPTGEHPRCEGAVRVVASYVRANAPDQSFAAITNAAGTALLYREGMAVDDRTVLRIERMRVVMQPNAGALCDLILFDPGSTGVATARPAVVAAAEPPAPSGDTGVTGIEAADLDANITAVSDTSWTITRSLVDRLLANQAALMSAARMIPHEEDGRVVGMKVYGIRRASLLGRLGIQNGDMLRTINGYDLSEPNSALEAYTNLRSADHLTLSVVRRGAATTLDYSIR